MIDKEKRNKEIEKKRREKREKEGKKKRKERREEKKERKKKRYKPFCQIRDITSTALQLKSKDGKWTSRENAYLRITCIISVQFTSQDPRPLA